MRVQFYTSSVSDTVDVDLGAVDSVAGATLWELAVVFFKQPCKVVNLSCLPTVVTPDPEQPDIVLPASACTKNLCVHVVTRALDDPAKRAAAAELAQHIKHNAHVPPFHTYSYT